MNNMYQQPAQSVCVYWAAYAKKLNTLKNHFKQNLVY